MWTCVSACGIKWKKKRKDDNNNVGACICKIFHSKAFAKWQLKPFFLTSFLNCSVLYTMEYFEVVLAAYFPFTSYLNLQFSFTLYEVLWSSSFCYTVTELWTILLFSAMVFVVVKCNIVSRSPLDCSQLNYQPELYYLWRFYVTSLSLVYIVKGKPYVMHVRHE